MQRAKQDALTGLVLDEMDALIWMAARHGFVLPEDKRVPEIKPSLQWEFDRNMSRLADRFEGPYLAGDTFTLPDILCTHCIDWAARAKFDITSTKMHDYAETMRARPAYQRVLALAK